MTLEVKKNNSKLIKRIILGVVVLIAAIFFGRVALWENNYYQSMEGSERAIALSAGDVSANNPDEEEIDTTEVTEQMVKEYIVAPDMPRYLSISKIGVKNARIFSVGTTSDGRMDTPKGIYDVGWWNGSNLPGTGGTAILDGHSALGKYYALFDDLPKLVSGDTITIEMGNGALLTYRVYDNITVTLDEANEKMAALTRTPVEGTESISIITCTGDWSDKQQTMLKRQFLRATLVSKT
ncbi:MAG: class F sortase [Candidatus Saccharibacteria bacterium]|nr:class F sortase [Candidatus Saccharibacteria bacterium]